MDTGMILNKRQISSYSESDSSSDEGSGRGRITLVQVKLDVIVGKSKHRREKSTVITRSESYSNWANVSESSDWNGNRPYGGIAKEEYPSSPTKKQEFQSPLSLNASELSNIFQLDASKINQSETHTFYLGKSHGNIILELKDDESSGSSGSSIKAVKSGSSRGRKLTSQVSGGAHESVVTSQGPKSTSQVSDGAHEFVVTSQGPESTCQVSDGAHESVDTFPGPKSTSQVSDCAHESVVIYHSPAQSASSKLELKDFESGGSGGSSTESEKSDSSKSTSQVADGRHSVFTYHSPTQSPLVQRMDRLERYEYDPLRIPSSVFQRSKSTTPLEWSLASNESLFSIHVGNSSFSRDHVFIIGDMGKAGDPTTSAEVIVVSPPPEATPTEIRRKVEKLQNEPNMAEIANATIKGPECQVAVGRRQIPQPGVSWDSCNVTRSDESESSTNSFAFPIICSLADAAHNELVAADAKKKHQEMKHQEMKHQEMKHQEMKHQETLGVILSSKPQEASCFPCCTPFDCKLCRSCSGCCCSSCCSSWCRSSCCSCSSSRSFCACSSFSSGCSSWSSSSCCSFWSFSSSSCCSWSCSSCSSCGSCSSCCSCSSGCVLNCCPFHSFRVHGCCGCRGCRGCDNFLCCSCRSCRCSFCC